MANRIGFTDTLTGKETVCGTWAKSGLRKERLPDEELPVL